MNDMATGRIERICISPINFQGVTTTTGTLISISGVTYGSVFKYTLNVKNSAAVSEGSNVATVSWSSPSLGETQSCTFYGAKIAIGQMWGTGGTVRQSKGTYDANTTIMLHMVGIIGY